MARPVRCPSCGLTQLAKETCKKCGTPLGVTTVPVAQTMAPPAPPPSVPAPPSPPPAENAVNPYAPPAASHQGAPIGLDAFDRDRFLLRQKLLTVHEKYEVWDEQGQPVLYVERPGRHLRNIGAALGAIAAGLLVGGLFTWISVLLDSPALVAPALILAILAIFTVGVALSAKRHLYFYRDESKSELLLEVLQDQKFVLLTRTFTVNDPRGQQLARFSKNLLTDVFRKKWICTHPSGQILCVATEDSRYLLRRFLTRLFPMCFYILDGGSGALIGNFDRKFTLLDRYVLDLSGDPHRALDRRIALALGVMLDTGEHR